MWEPRRLTSLWASTACYRDNFTFLPMNVEWKVNKKQEFSAQECAKVENQTEFSRVKWSPIHYDIADRTPNVTLLSVCMQCPETYSNLWIRIVSSRLADIRLLQSHYWDVVPLKQLEKLRNNEWLEAVVGWPYLYLSDHLVCALGNHNGELHHEIFWVSSILCIASVWAYLFHLHSCNLEVTARTGTDGLHVFLVTR
jgi:hypothetical protein